MCESMALTNRIKTYNMMLIDRFPPTMNAAEDPLSKTNVPVGDDVGWVVGDAVGAAVGACVGVAIGDAVGVSVCMPM